MLPFQADYDAYNVDPENLWNSSIEDDSFVTNTGKENQDEGRDTTDNIRIVSVSGGVSAAETVVMESRGAVATAADATLSTNVKVIEPKDMVQIASTKGAIYIEKSNLPQLGKYEEHVQIYLGETLTLNLSVNFVTRCLWGRVLRANSAHRNESNSISRLISPGHSPGGLVRIFSKEGTASLTPHHTYRPISRQSHQLSLLHWLYSPHHQLKPV